jgi:hypothetical protein
MIHNFLYSREFLTIEQDLRHDQKKYLQADFDDLFIHSHF